MIVYIITNLTVMAETYGKLCYSFYYIFINYFGNFEVLPLIMKITISIYLSFLSSGGYETTILSIIADHLFTFRF